MCKPLRPLPDRDLQASQQRRLCDCDIMSLQCRQVAGYHVAYVGNLAFEADDAEVQQLFPDCNVTKVRLHTDKATGKSRGFAHVHFLDEPSLDK